MSYEHMDETREDALEECIEALEAENARLLRRLHDLVAEHNKLVKVMSRLDPWFDFQKVEPSPYVRRKYEEWIRELAE